MSTSRIHALSRNSRALILSVLVVAIAAFGASSASANGSSNAVTLDWIQANVFNTSATTGYDRTFLGYTTNTTDTGAGPPSGGSVTPSGAAYGDTVTTASARGAAELYTHSFPAVEGSVSESATAPSGELTFNGTVTYVVNSVVATITNPRIVFNGDGTGQLFATGHGINDADFTDAAAVFNLDFNGEAPNGGAPASQPGLQAGWDAAEWVLHWDGSRTLQGIVPSIATYNLFYGTSYLADSGPDRIPNRFGTFSITINPQSGPKGADGPAGPAGPTGPAGPAGKDASVKSVVLKKAPFAKRSRLAAKVYKGKKLVGYANVIGRKVRVTFIGTELDGRYRLVEIGGKKRTARVTLG